MHPGRLRLRPWLEEQIESGRYPGVMWLDEIPWKHAARHGWNIETDATLFRNWAIHTGRYRPGTDKPDPKTWKANFRCALNSLSDVKELHEKSIKKGHNAFRVYALLPQSKSLKRRRALRNLETDIKSESPSSTQRHTALERFTEAFWTFADDGGTAEVPRTEDPSECVEEDRSPIYCCSSAQGLQVSRTDQKEQTEAVLKIVDHLKNLEHWSPLYDSDRSWRPNSTWMECVCETMDFSGHTYQTDCNLHSTSSHQYD